MIGRSKGLVRETFITVQFCYCVNDYLLINDSKIKNIYEMPETKKIPQLLNAPIKHV